MIKASEEFVEGKNGIGYVSSSFTDEFGNDEVLSGSVLKFNKLDRNMKDSEIIKEFNVQECTIGDILATLQNATEDMKDGYANIFYVKGHSRVVGVYWYGDEWFVHGWSRVADAWRRGHRVFSLATEAVTNEEKKCLSTCEHCSECGDKSSLPEQEVRGWEKEFDEEWRKIETTKGGKFGREKERDWVETDTVYDKNGIKQYINNLLRTHRSSELKELCETIKGMKRTDETQMSADHAYDEAVEEILSVIQAKI